jgi:hypothetical protein
VRRGRGAPGHRSSARGSRCNVLRFPQWEGWARFSGKPAGREPENVGTTPGVGVGVGVDVGVGDDVQSPGAPNGPTGPTPDGGVLPSEGVNPSAPGSGTQGAALPSTDTFTALQPPSASGLHGLVGFALFALLALALGALRLRRRRSTF